MEDYASNSNKSRAANKVTTENKVKPVSVVERAAEVPEPGAINKITKALLAEDLKTVVLYLLKDEFVPNVKKMLYKGVGLWLGVDTETAPKQNSDRTSYRDYYDRRERRGAIHEFPREDNRIVHDYVSTRYYSRADAEAVKAELESIIEADGYATINNLYIAANMNPRDFTYDDYGWGDIRNARITNEYSYKDSRNYWYLKMPRAYPVGD